jgi:hypothetical protein
MINDQSLDQDFDCHAPCGDACILPLLIHLASAFE